MMYYLIPQTKHSIIFGGACVRLFFLSVHLYSIMSAAAGRSARRGSFTLGFMLLTFVTVSSLTHMMTQCTENNVTYLLHNILFVQNN
jgi:hypothetical protein